MITSRDSWFIQCRQYIRNDPITFFRIGYADILDNRNIMDREEHNGMLLDAGIQNDILVEADNLEYAYILLTAYSNP